MGLSLDLNNIFDEMFHIKENIHFWVHFVHANELISIDKQNFILWDQSHKHPNFT